MIEINLVPDVKQELLKAQRIRVTVISFSIVVGLIAAGVVTLLAVYVFAVQGVRGNLADGSIKSESQKLSNVEDLTKTLTIQNQLEQLNSLHANKPISSRIFDLLQAVNPAEPNDVKISSLAIDTSSKTIKIEGQSNSFNAVDIFKKTLDGAKIKFKDGDSDQEVTVASDVIISDTNWGEDSSGNRVTRFTLNFTYADELFAVSSGSPTFVISTTGNVTDSYLGVPKSLFVAPATDGGSTN